MLNLCPHSPQPGQAEAQRKLRLQAVTQARHREGLYVLQLEAHSVGSQAVPAAEGARDRKLPQRKRKAAPLQPQPRFWDGFGAKAGARVRDGTQGK